MDHSHVLSDQEIRRFAGQISMSQVGVDGQTKLKEAKVAVIGAGSLGSIVLQYLSAIGLGYLEIIDYTIVQETDVQRQILYGGNDLGKLKTIISKQKLQNLFPVVQYGITNIQISTDNAVKILKEFDCIVDATNIVESHRIINSACKEIKMLWVYGAVSEFKGEVSVFEPNKGYEDFKPALDPMNGSTALTFGIIGNLMALEVFKILTGHPEVLLHKSLTADLLTYQFSVNTF